jgi:hypothetical protein
MNLNEPILPDDFPIHPGCLFVADGKVIESKFKGTIKGLKALTGANEIRRCDIYRRIRMMNDDQG